MQIKKYSFYFFILETLKHINTKHYKMKSSTICCIALIQLMALCAVTCESKHPFSLYNHVFFITLFKTLLICLEKLVAITVATEETDGFIRYQRSLMKYNYTFEVQCLLYKALNIPYCPVCINLGINRMQYFTVNFYINMRSICDKLFNIL